MLRTNLVLFVGAVSTSAGRSSTVEFEGGTVWWLALADWLATVPRFCLKEDLTRWG